MESNHAVHACDKYTHAKSNQTQHIHVYDDLVKGVLGTGPRPGIGHPERRELQDASSFCERQNAAESLSPFYIFHPRDED